MKSIVLDAAFVKRSFLRSARSSENRTGAMLPFLAICMVIVVGVMAFAVDVSYMHTLRAELRLASDAAARSGTETLRRTQSPDQAVAKAIEIAAMNKVGGNPVKLTTDDVQLGQTEYQPDGSWKFVQGKLPTQALRVNVRFGKGTPNAAIPLFFGKFWGIQSVASKSESIAAHFEQDIVLSLDRSHSMAFDMSGVDWVYPKETLKKKKDPYTLRPGEATSRWAALQRAVDAFTSEVSNLNAKPQVSLVTWASTTSIKGGENLPVYFTSPEIDILESFTTNYDNISNKARGKGGKAMVGGTNMSAGMYAAINQFNDSKARPLAIKTMILMTDGQWNMGTNPVTVAREAAAKGIKIHTVTFLEGTDSTEMAEVARVTGGTHFHAATEEELQQAFIDLARMLPVVLTN